MHVGRLSAGQSELEGSFAENKVSGCGRLVRGEILFPEVGEFIPGNFLTLYKEKRFNDTKGVPFDLCICRFICTYDSQFFERFSGLSLCDPVISAHVAELILIDRFVT